MPFDTTRPTAGFTVIELLVTAAIIAAVSLVVFVQYGSFNGSTLIINQAYKIALDIREAQVFSLGERLGDATARRSEYGVYFNTDPDSPDTLTQYITFRDTADVADEPSPTYDNETDELISIQNLDPRFVLKEIKTNDGNSVDEVSISFRRPNYDAIFGGTSSVESADYIDIVVETDDGGVSQTIRVTNTGQITVQ